MPVNITTIYPSKGDIAGGTVITLLGTGFIGTTSVLFDTTPAQSFTVISDTELRATSPAHAVGNVNITVSRPQWLGPYITGTRAVVNTENLTLPVDANNGDLMIVAATCNTNAPAVPSGWTQFALQSDSNYPIVILLWKLSPGLSAGGGITLNGQITKPILMVIKGAYSAAPIEAVQGAVDDAGTLLTAPSITTTVSNTLGLIYAVQESGVAIGPVTSGGWTGLHSGNSGGTLSYKNNAGAGAQGSVNVGYTSGSSSDGWAYQFAIRPA